MNINKQMLPHIIYQGANILIEYPLLTTNDEITNGCFEAFVKSLTISAEIVADNDLTLYKEIVDYYKSTDLAPHVMFFISAMALFRNIDEPNFNEEIYNNDDEVYAVKLAQSLLPSLISKIRVLYNFPETQDERYKLFASVLTSVVIFAEENLYIAARILFYFSRMTRDDEWYQSNVVQPILKK